MGRSERREALLYATGTTTPANTYQQASAVPPTPTGCCGLRNLFAPICLDGATIHRAILKPRAARTIQDIDPLNAAVVPGADTVSDTELATGAAAANLGYTPLPMSPVTLHGRGEDVRHTDEPLEQPTSASVAFP